MIVFWTVADHHKSRQSRARRQQRSVRKPAPDVRRQQAGRPTLYTPELGVRIAKLVALGVAIGVACAAEGIGRATLYEWRAKSRDGRQPYAGFLAELERALARVEVEITKNVIAASKRDWRAGAWWLERRRPRRYALRQSLRVEKAPADMTDEELDAAIARAGYVPSSKVTQNP